MSRVTYVRYELPRSFRNWRFFILSPPFPLILYYPVARALGAGGGGRADGRSSS